MRVALYVLCIDVKQAKDETKYDREVGGCVREEKGVRERFGAKSTCLGYKNE